MSKSTFATFGRRTKANLMSGAALLAIAAAPFSVSAQQGADDAEVEIEEVVVTGSRIARKDLVAASPVNVISNQSIQLSGVNQIGTLINELPSAGVPGSVDTATNFRTTTTGLNTINLRNLGAERTLVLVNGRRHIGGSAGSPVVDVSMIPAALVDRAEIVTGGASAVYGSEAMSGVVNFIMRDDFEGIEVNGRIGTSDHGGADELDGSLLVGSNFDDDKGNAVFYIGYSDRGILRSSDRELSANDAVNSTFGPKGNFFVPGVGFITEDESTGIWDKPYVAAEDGFDRNAVRLIRVPSERIQFNANINYRVNDHFNLFSETAYNELTSYSQLEPTIVGDFISVGSLAANIRIPIDNPFVPTELRDAILAGDPTATEIQMFRRFVELGPRSSDVQRRTFRTLFGMNGDINDTWSYEAYYQYGNLTQDQTNGGVFNTLNFYNALRVEDDGNGGLQCVDIVARGQGCVPINVFGRGSIEGAALDFVSVDSQLTARMKQQVAGVSFTGSPLELPAGELGLAFGWEWREEKSQFNSDSLAQSGLTSGNTTPNTAGQYDVHEFFAEAIVPVLSDVPFAEYLGLELAARYADYSTIGGNWAWKASLDWRPMEDLKVRGGFSRAVRAPNIGELFDPGSETFRSFVDPCAFGGAGGASGDGQTTYQTQSAAVQAACATIPGTATLDPFALNIRSAGGLSAGNPDLGEETAETLTVGFVYTPSQIPGLNITLDYFDIKISDAINSFTAQTTVDQCVRQPDFPNNAFCDLIQRDPTTGLVLRIDALAINVAEFRAKGFDFAVDYSFAVGEGNLGINLNGTYSTANDFVPFDGGDVVDSQGEIGVPDWKVNATLSYELGNWLFGWSTRFIDGVNVENDQIDAFGTIGSYFYNDLQVRYRLGDDYQYEIFAGVDNIFDKAPPFLGQGVPGDVTGTNTAADVYDAIRRYGYVGFRARF